MNPKLYDSLQKIKKNLSYIYKIPLVILIYPFVKFAEFMEYLSNKWFSRYDENKVIKKLSKKIYKKMLRYKNHREQYFVIANDRSHWYEGLITKYDYNDFVPYSDRALREGVRGITWTSKLQEQLIFELRKYKYLEVSVLTSDNHRNFKYISRNNGFIQAYKITMKS